MTHPFQKICAEIGQRSPHPEKVTILGACKGQSLDRIENAVQAGLTVLGNNYAQEGEQVRKQLSQFKGKWHFIGHIQSRKARDLIHYDCIQSLDRIKVAQELNRRAEKPLSVLIEINLGEENSKSGISATELPGFLNELKTFSNLRVDGLMGMPPPLQPVESRRPYFKKLKELFDRWGNGEWHQLSMGTSEDYPIALEEGSTLIRLGTVLFGERPAK